MSLNDEKMRESYAYGTFLLGDVTPTLLTLVRDLLCCPVGVDLFDLRLIVLHEQEVGGQGTLGCIRIMGLATLLGVGFGGSKDWSAACNSGRRHTSRSYDWNGNWLWPKEGQRETAGMSIGQESVELCNVCALELVDAGF